MSPNAESSPAPVAAVVGRPLLLDAFCGAGGASMGYYRAGFDVIGVDIAPQKNYPFPFIQADALEFLASVKPGDFAAIHCSPPCQAHSNTQKIRGNAHPDLIGKTRALLEAIGLPFIIENVPGAPLRSPVVLEGQLFEGLRTSRPRLFETNWPLMQPLLPPPPRHTKMGRKPRPDEFMHVVGHFSDVAAGRAAMGIEWMSRDELSQAIPPAFTEYVGSQWFAIWGRPGVPYGCSYERAEWWFKYGDMDYPPPLAEGQPQ